MAYVATQFSSLLMIVAMAMIGWPLASLMPLWKLFVLFLGIHLFSNCFAISVVKQIAKQDAAKAVRATRQGT